MALVNPSTSPDPVPSLQVTTTLGPTRTVVFAVTVNALSVPASSFHSKEPVDFTFVQALSSYFVPVPAFTLQRPICATTADADAATTMPASAVHKNAVTRILIRLMAIPP